MEIRQLSKDEFHGTFCGPMRRLGADESYRPVPLKDYVAECIRSLGLPTTLADIEIHHVYLSADKRHTHVLFYFGEHNRYLVIVVGHEPDAVKGHFLLDLTEEYGLAADHETA
ncbi:MAG: hypothetical protein U1F71_21720 [Verrucomicrobiaceae bacterium]